MRKIVLILALVGAAIAAAGQALPSGSVLFGQNTWLAPDGSVWTGKDGYGYKKLLSPDDLSNYVTTNTDQTITGAKTFTSTVRVTGVSSFGEGMNLVAGSNGAGGFAVIGGDTTRAAAFNDHGGFYIGYGTGIPGQVNVPIMQIHLPTGETTFNGDVKATEFYRTSTRKIKKDIAPFSENATSILNGVDVVEYKLKKGPDYKKIGFIAEDTHEYLSTPEHNVMDQGSSIGLLIKAVQELSAKVEELERRLAECQD